MRFSRYYFILSILVMLLTAMCSQQARNEVYTSLEGTWSDPSNNHIILIFGTNGTIIAENGAKLYLEINFQESNRVFIKEKGWNINYYRNTLPESIAKVVSDFPREKTYLDFQFYPEQGILQGTHHGIWHVFWETKRSPYGQVFYQFRRMETNYVIPAMWIKVKDEISNRDKIENDILLFR